MAGAGGVGGAGRRRPEGAGRCRKVPEGAGRCRKVPEGAAHCASTELRFCGCRCHAARVLVASVRLRRFHASMCAAAAASDCSSTNQSGSWEAARLSSHSRARSDTVSSNVPGVKDRDCSAISVAAISDYASHTVGQCCHRCSTKSNERFTHAGAGSE